MRIINKFAAILSLAIVSAQATVIDLRSGGVFETAVESLQPGDTLVVHAGTYSDAGRISISVKATAQSPSAIQGARGEARPLITRNASAAVQNTINIEGARYLTIQGLEIQGNGGDGINLNSNPSHITIEDNEIHEVDVAVNFRSSMDHIVVRKNHIYHTGIDGGTGEGMYVGCNNATCAVCSSTIEGNWIHDNLPGTTQGDGIEVKPGSFANVIRDNVIYNMNYPGIFNYGNAVVPNIIEGNVIWNCSEAMQLVSDAIVRNNIVFNSDQITLSTHTQIAKMQNVTIVNNTFYNLNGGLYIRWSGASNMTLANNAVYSGGHTAINASGLTGSTIAIQSNYVEGALSGASLDKIRFFDGGTSANAFVNPAQNNFWLKITSPLIGVADKNYAPSSDFNGTARSTPFDVGAYETDRAVNNPGWQIQQGFKNGSSTGLVFSWEEAPGYSPFAPGENPISILGQRSGFLSDSKMYNLLGQGVFSKGEPAPGVHLLFMPGTEKNQYRKLLLVR